MIMTQSSSRNGRGIALLHDPRLNKDTAFSEEEREAHRLVGLLPDAVEDIERQKRRVMLHLGHKPTDLERYIYLMDLLDRDETLFYRILMSDPARFLPIVYDPTVGEACLKFGHIYRRPRGMYVSMQRKGHFREVLRNWRERNVRFICVSTGGRILGLGDLGANGMGIPIGKLQLYTACAGVPPDGLLPMLFDCGTNNRELLNDPLYLGVREPRPPTPVLDELVEELVQAVQHEFPSCCIHFEDWRGTDALRLLGKYREQICCYNDDIQGTGSVTVAGLLNAVRIAQHKLADERVLFLGAGSAAIGIADMIVSAMKLEGLSEEAARARVSLFDVNGLVEPSRKDLNTYQHRYAHPRPASTDFAATIESLKPTVLIGVSTKGRAFDRRVIEAMARLNERPIVFALSNPTDHAECTAEEAYRWSHGRAIFAAGVQFPPVALGGKTFLPGQANNFYVFPAVSLAVYATKAARVTDEMFIEAARAVADQVSPEQFEQGLLFPPQSNVLESEVHTAERVAALVFDRRLARVDRPKDLGSWLRGALYKPEYGKV
jgi:malate dehydrogenase (oxaloacetate-decarboxylating)(NADP+)